MRDPQPATLVDRTIGGAIDVLLVADDPTRLDGPAAELDRHDRVAVTTGSLADAIGRPHPADCIVSDHETPQAGLDHVERIRASDESVPVVLYTPDPPESVLDELFAHAWTDYQPRNADADAIAGLARRIRGLVDRRRTRAALRRTTAGLAATRDGIAIADPDGTVAFANGQYARAFGIDRARIVGTHWRERFTDAEAERLATDAIPTAAEGWRWTGRCTGLDEDGARVTLRTSVVGLPDESLVFVIEPADRRSDDS